MLSDHRRSGPLRLLWLIDSLGPGGAERLAAAFARAVDPSRVRLTVCALKRIGTNPYEAALREAGCEAVELESHGLRDAGAFRRLLALVREERIELVHAHLTDASIWGAVAARLTGVPMLATLHVDPCEEPAWSRRGIRERLMCGLLSRWSAGVLAVSARQREAWLRAGRLPAERVAVVHNGIDTDDFAPTETPARERVLARRELGVPDDAPLAMTVAVLRGPDKGIDVLLDAVPAVLERVPDARFVVVGGGPMEQRFRDLARMAGLVGRVSFTGYRRDTARLLRSADAFVLPSRVDPLPTAILEAMAAGLPVVSTAVGGVPEIVDASRTGMLVAPGDASALADALATMLAHPAASRHMGEAGRARVRERFGMDVWLAALEGAYARALAGPARTASPALETA
jgi:glycosyltransferase involved in cell wall biosynthesis